MSDPPLEEVEFLELIVLKLQLVSGLSKFLIYNHSPPLGLDKTLSICSRAHSAADSLVKVTIKFANQYRGAETDLYRKQGRRVKLLVKNLIYHTTNPYSDTNEQITELIRVSINLSVPLNILLSRSTKRIAELKKEQPNSFAMCNSFSLPKYTPKTYEEKIRMLLNQVKEFMELLKELSIQTKQFVINEEEYTSIDTVNLLNSNSDSDDKYLEFFQHQKKQIELQSKCDTLHTFSCQITEAFRSYIETSCYKNPDEKQSLLILTSSLRGSLSHILCVLVSYIFFFFF